MAHYYLLGGRAYRSAATQTTIQQDARTMALLRKYPALQRAIDGDGDLLGALLDSDPASFVAQLLVEDTDGKVWTPEDAAANAVFFNGLTDAESKAQFFDALTILLSDFFALGGSSSTASPTSSEPRRERGTKGRRRRSSRRAVTPPSDSASGPASSPVSPTSTASA
jgi:hypothetical protein